MSRRATGKNKSSNTYENAQNQNGIINLDRSIEEVQVEAGITDRIIRRVTGELTDYRIQLLREMPEFGNGFLKEETFNMCFLELQTESAMDHSIIAKRLHDTLKWKTNKEGFYKDHNEWVIDVFCYDDFELLTPFALTVILLKRITDYFHKKHASDRLETFQVSHSSNENVEPGFQKAADILSSLVIQILRKFPKVSLRLIISGITNNYPRPQRLATFVLMLGRLMERVRREIKSGSRIKCIFCGTNFWEPFERRYIDENGIERQTSINPLLTATLDFAGVQSQIKGQDLVMQAVINHMLALRWHDKRWRRKKLSANMTS